MRDLIAYLRRMAKLTVVFDTGSRRLRQRHSSDRPQQSRGAGRHGQMCEQPGSWLSAECETGPGLRPGQPAGALGMAGE
ncbi:hypothetical protein BK022_21545 [Methylorubrum extorquens]|uniref:Uncharacterized protein n=1 Tax=Methylorubrum extorquens TaxID=408 RepID=A0A1S1P1V0_METEX|nr:hypothetical protein BK022_21545 [Methylorubrum extorquens]